MAAAAGNRRVRRDPREETHAKGRARRGAAGSDGARADAAASGRGRREPVQARSRRTVERILRAAEALVAEEGVDAATTRAIAERAGVSAPSLYRFFDDRDAILDALLEVKLLELETATTEAEQAFTGASVAEFVQLQFDLHVSYYRRHPSLARLWFGGRVSPPVVELVHERNRALARRARELLTGAGLLAPDTPQVACDLLVEFGDRALELAFRDSRPDPRVLGAAAEGLTAFAERWSQAGATAPAKTSKPEEGR